MAVHTHDVNLLAQVPEVLLPLERTHHDFGGGDLCFPLRLNLPSSHDSLYRHSMPWQLFLRAAMRTGFFAQPPMMTRCSCQSRIATLPAGAGPVRRDCGLSQTCDGFCSSIIWTAVVASKGTRICAGLPITCRSCASLFLQTPFLFERSPQLPTINATFPTSVFLFL